MDTPAVREWTAKPDQRLEIPAELTAAVTVRARLHVGREVLTLRARAHEILGPGWIRFTGVLVDTSDRHEGVTLRRRVTFRPELTVYCTGAVLLAAAEGAD